MSQQDQTLEYFKSHADDWQRKATDQTYSVIENRHLAVLETMGLYAPGSSLLDVGCGTGQLAIEASRRGWRANGIDFAREMVDLCVANNSAAGASASFECASIFDISAEPESYDVVSALGFIEYISLQQIDQFLDFARTTLKPNGALALGSRNRLFNLHTLNDFTELEEALGTISMLLREGRIFQTAKTQEDALSEAAKLKYDYEQPTTHPRTGVKVDIRYQFTPADLVSRLAQHGLKATRIYPVHYHPLPVSMMGDEDIKAIHTQFAALASRKWIASQKLVPYSSSFVIEAKKS